MRERLVAAAALTGAIVLGLPGLSTAQNPAQHPAQHPAQAAAPGDDRRLQAEAMLVRGMTRVYLGDDDGAIPIFERAAALAPDAAPIQAALAAAFARQGRTGRALEHARRAVELDSTRADYGLEFAALSVVSGSPLEALAMLDRMAAVHPDQPDVLLDLARLLNALEQRTRSLQVYRQMLGRWDLPDEVVEEAISLELALGNALEALALIDEQVRRHPGDAILVHRRGETLVRLGRIDDAIGAFERAATLDPDDRESREALDDLYGRRNVPVAGDSPARLVADAERDLAAIARGDAGAPSPASVAGRLEPLATDANLQASFLLGLALRLNDRAAEAIPVFTRVVDRDPARLEAWQALIESLRSSGDPIAALRASEDAALFFPGDVQIALLAGFAALEALRPAEASDAFDRALRGSVERHLSGSWHEAVALAGSAAARMLSGETGTGSALLGRSDPGTLIVLATAPLDPADGPTSGVRFLLDFGHFDSVRWWRHFAISESNRAGGWTSDEPPPGAENPSGKGTDPVPGWPVSEALRAAGAAASGAYSDARSILERTSSARPRSPLLHLLLGDLDAATGSASSARAHWQAARELAPASLLVAGRLDPR